MASKGAATDCKREERAPEDSGVVADVGMENVAIQRQPSLEHGCRKLDYNDLEFGEAVGAGASGTVYKGKLGKTWDVAIKEIGKLDKTFEQEIDKLSKLKHPNIIKLYGRCSHDRHCYIIAEFAEKGSLNDHIEGNRGKPHKESSLRWAAEITEGMCYLHGNGVVHRDLKPRNILLTGKTTAKICDFGIACDLDRTKTVSQVVGTHCYIAREVLLKEKYSNSCDVFSFGMVLWELVTHETPFEGKPECLIPNAIINGEFPDIPSHVEEYIADLIKKCWNIREDRPKFKEVQKILKEKCPVIKRLDMDSSEVTVAPNTQTVRSQPPNMAPANGSPSNGSVATPPSTLPEQAQPQTSGPEEETDSPGGTPSPQPKEGNDTNGDSQAAAGDGTASLEQPAKEEQNITTPAIVSPSNGTEAVATPPPSALQEQAAPLTSGVATGGVDTDSAAPSTSQLPVQEQPQSSALADKSLGTSSGSVAANSTPPSSELQRQSSAGYQNLQMNIESGLTNKPTYSLNPLGAPAGVSPSNGSVATPPSTQTEQAPPPTNVVADGGHMNTESFSEVTNNSSLQSLYMSGAAVPQTSSGRSTNAVSTTRQPVQGLEQGLATADVSATSSAVVASTRSSTHTTVPDQPLQQSHSVEIVSRSGIPLQPRQPTNATAGVSPSNGSVPPSTGTPRSNIQSQTHGGFAEPRNDMGTNPLGNTQALQSQPQKRVEKNGSVAAANSSGIAHPPSQPQPRGAAVSQTSSGRNTNPEASHQPVQGQHQRLVVNRDDLWELVPLLDPIAASWDLFLGQLPEFPHDQIKKISANVTKQREDPKSCFIRGLEQLCDSKKNVTYGDIAAIMEKSMLPNKPLARRIRRDYKGQYNTIVSSKVVRPLVENYLHEVAASWKLFLRQLRMSGSEVDQIEGCGDYAISCLTAGLEFWVKHANEPTYKQIAAILRGNVVTNYPLARRVEEIAKKECQDPTEVSQTDDTHTPPSPRRAGPGRTRPVGNVMDQTPLNWEVANGFKWTNKQRAEKTFRPTEMFSDKWEDLGKQFGYAPAVLRGYERECLGKNEGCFKKVIDRWLEDGSDEYPQTWSGLCKALKDVGGVSKYVASFEDAIRNKK